MIIANNLGNGQRGNAGAHEVDATGQQAWPPPRHASVGVISSAQTNRIVIMNTHWSFSGQFQPFSKILTTSPDCLRARTLRLCVLSPPRPSTVGTSSYYVVQAGAWLRRTHKTSSSKPNLDSSVKTCSMFAQRLITSFARIFSWRTHIRSYLVHLPVILWLKYTHIDDEMAALNIPLRISHFFIYCSQIRAWCDHTAAFVCTSCAVAKGKRTAVELSLS